MKKTILLILIVALIVSGSACSNNNKQVTDYLPMQNFYYYSNDSVIYHEVVHNQNGYSYNTLTKTSDDIEFVLQYYALLIGEFLTGFSGDSLKLSGDHVDDGTFFKFETYRSNAFTYSLIEIPLSSNNEIDQVIEKEWNSKVIPKMNSYEENIGKALRDNNQVIYTYKSKDINDSFNYYKSKTNSKDNYQLNEHLISYKDRDIDVVIEFDFENELFIITQNY